MTQLGTIQYRKKNWIHSSWEMASIICLGFAFVLFAVSHCWQYLFIGPSLIFLLYLIYKKPTEQVKFYSKGNNLFLLLNKENKSEELKINSWTFSWHNAVLPKFRQMGSSIYHTTKTRHTISTKLKLELKLNDNKNLVFVHNLYQWQETPRDWKYKLFYPEEYKEIFMTKSDLNELKKIFESELTAEKRQ